MNDDDDDDANDGNTCVCVCGGRRARKSGTDAEFRTEKKPRRPTSTGCVCAGDDDGDDANDDDVLRRGSVGKLRRTNFPAQHGAKWTDRPTVRPTGPVGLESVGLGMVGGVDGGGVVRQ